jgi:hypothetical protein
MEIRTQEDWWELATKTVPLLPEYMVENRPNLNYGMIEAELNKHLEAKDWKALHGRLQELYDALPDHASIRYQPFFDLCDLCSEVWVFYET